MHEIVASSPEANKSQYANLNPVRLLTARPSHRQEAVITAHAVIWFLAYLALFVAVCAGVQMHTGAYAGDLGRTGDEAAHFVNSAMIRDYVLHGLGTNPVRFALEYYAHLPRVSIGHWPPFFHLVQAGVFLLTGTSFAVAIGFQAIIAGAAAALTAVIVGPRAGGGAPGILIGLAAGSLVAGYAVASTTGVRPLGGVVLAAGAAVCTREWARTSGTGTAAATPIVGQVNQRRQ